MVLKCKLCPGGYDEDYICDKCRKDAKDTFTVSVYELRLAWRDHKKAIKEINPIVFFVWMIGLILILRYVKF